MLESTTLASISNFISRHGDMKVVICSSAEEDGLCSLKLLRTLLHSCPNLHHLDFTYFIFGLCQRGSLAIDDEIVRALLMHSTLKTFRLNSEKVMLSQVVLKQENLVTNESLRRLDLDLGRCSDVAKFFLKTFRNLRHLHLRCSSTTDSILRTIWKYQVRLYDMIQFV